jgi:hypothetical protein
MTAMTTTGTRGDRRVSGSKRKRRRPDYRAPGSSPEAAAGSSRPAQSGARGTGGILGSLFRGSPGDSPYPKLRISFERAVLAVCSSPAIMLSIAALVFALRLVLVLLGVPARGSVFAAVLALPPVGTVLDLQAAGTVFGDATGFLIAPAFLLVRSLILAVLTGMIVESLRTGRVSARGALGGLRALPPIFGVGIIELGSVFMGSLIIGFTGLGLLGVVLVLVAILFAFGYAPVISVREPRGLQWIARKSIRAARIPGSQNVFLALIYTILALVILPVLIPGGQVVAVNPGVATWIGILLVNLFHVVFLAVYCHRYLYAEDEIPDPPEPRRRS